MHQSGRFAPPPRRVPLSLTVANFFNGGTQIGWFLFGFGMIFVWAFVMNGDYSFATFRGPFGRAYGVVTRIVKTNASEGGGKHSRGTPIYENHYVYSVAGQGFSGISYSTGERVQMGDRVEIEFQEGQPDRSRIAGMRRSMFGPFVLFVLIFPTVGLILILVFTRTGTKRNYLLRYGVLTDGKLVSKEPTNMSVNRQTVYELTFEFAGYDGRMHQAKARSHQPHRMEDEAREPLLYDAENPSRAYILDEAPARPKLDEMGELHGNLSMTILLLVVPLIVIIGHGTFLLYKLGIL